jgi:hypothetical protein
MLIPSPLAIDEVIATIQYLKHSKEKSKLSLLFNGGQCPDAKTDERTPSLDRPLTSIFKASLWGVTFPWNLILSVFLGVFLMCYPSFLYLRGLLFDLDPILGALTVVVSVISCSEFLRRMRYFNLGFALVLFVSAWFSSHFFVLHIVTAIAIALLCLRKGNFRERGSYAHHSL